MRRRRWLGIAVAVVAVLGLSACGDDDGADVRSSGEASSSGSGSGSASSSGSGSSAEDEGEALVDEYCDRVQEIVDGLTSGEINGGAVDGLLEDVADDLSSDLSTDLPDDLAELADEGPCDVSVLRPADDPPPTGEVDPEKPSGEPSGGGAPEVRAYCDAVQDYIALLRRVVDDPSSAAELTQAASELAAQAGQLSEVTAPADLARIQECTQAASDAAQELVPGG